MNGQPLPSSEVYGQALPACFTKEARVERAAKRAQRREYSLQSEPWATMTVTSSNAGPKEEK
jgi:hypothetical protein